MKKFSERLKFLRTSKKLMQQDMATTLNISLRQYQRYEKGEQEPDFDGLIFLCSFFNVSADYLLGLKEEKC